MSKYTRPIEIGILIETKTRNDICVSVPAGCAVRARRIRIKHSVRTEFQTNVRKSRAKRNGNVRKFGKRVDGEGRNGHKRIFSWSWLNVRKQSATDENLERALMVGRRRDRSAVLVEFEPFCHDFSQSVGHARSVCIETVLKNVAFGQTENRKHSIKSALEVAQSVTRNVTVPELQNNTSTA